MIKRALFPFLASVVFSGSFVAGKYTTYELGPFTTSFLRYFVALVFLAVLLFRFGLKSLRIHIKDIFHLSLIGLFGIVIYHSLFLIALGHTLVANTAIINAFNPVVTSVLSVLFLREILKWKNYLGVAIAFAGVLCLLSKGDISRIYNFNFARGDLIMIVAMLSFVVYALLVKPISRRYSSFTITFYSTLSAVIILLIMSFTENNIEQIAGISFRTAVSILYMGIFGSALGYLFYNMGIKELGTTKTSSIVYSFVPVFATILSFLFFNESITIVLFVSIIMIVAGLNMALRAG
jgi:drug/metabolite transporter (DMT)-like permease